MDNGIASYYSRSITDGKKFPQCANSNSDSVIVIIAESPHTSEFLFKNGAVVTHRGPLHRYDNRILHYLQQNHNGWFNNAIKYDFFILNAIQYQCSFGLPLWNYPTNQQQKENVFKYAWITENGEGDLISRVNSIIYKRKNVIILNACTASLKPYCNSSFLNKI